MASVGWRKRSWQFRRDGCCGKGEPYKSPKDYGKTRLCGGRVLVVRSPVTYDKAVGLLPRVMEAECARCGLAFHVYPRTGRVERRNP